MQPLDYCDKHRNAKIEIPDFDKIAAEKKEAHRIYMLNWRRGRGAMARPDLTEEQREERKRKSKQEWYRRKMKLKRKEKIVTSVTIHQPRPKVIKEKEQRIPKMTYRYVLNPKTVYYFDDKEKMDKWISKNVNKPDF